MSRQNANAIAGFLLAGLVLAAFNLLGDALTSRVDPVAAYILGFAVVGLIPAAVQGKLYAIAMMGVAEDEKSTGLGHMAFIKEVRLPVALGAGLAAFATIAMTVSWAQSPMAVLVIIAVGTVSAWLGTSAGTILGAQLYMRRLRRLLDEDKKLDK